MEISTEGEVRHCGDGGFIPDNTIVYLDESVLNSLKERNFLGDLENCYILVNRGEKTWEISQRTPIIPTVPSRMGLDNPIAKPMPNIRGRLLVKDGSNKVTCTCSF